MLISLIIFLKPECYNSIYTGRCRLRKIPDASQDKGAQMFFEHFYLLNKKRGFLRRRNEGILLEKPKKKHNSFFRYIYQHRISWYKLIFMKCNILEPKVFQSQCLKAICREEHIGFVIYLQIFITYTLRIYLQHIPSFWTSNASFLFSSFL